MRTKLLAWITVPLLLIVSFTAVAFAAGATTPDEGSILDLARPVLDAALSGQWFLAVALALVFACAGVRKYLPDGWGGSFVRSDFGGMITAFVMSFAGAVATALAAAGPGAVLSGALAFAALKIAVAAVGGYKALHELGKWLTATTWYQDKAPGFVKAIVSLVLGLIGSDAIAKSEAAGAAAVQAQPSGGAAAITGGGEAL